MKTDLPDLPVIREALEVWRRLVGAGHTAYFAGGMVRDLALGLPPKDADIATSAPTEEIERLFPTGRFVGRAFGVYRVPQPESLCEIATFRTDGPYLDGRRPAHVAPGTPREDALRRDFTINGLFYDPRTGALLDEAGGLSDLQTRTLRAIGDPFARFGEDRLRIFRAVRFAARLEFTIDPATWEAMVRLAPETLSLAPERVREELTLILASPRARSGLELLDGSGLLGLWLPEVAALKGVPQPPDHHPEGDVFEHVARVLHHLDPRPPVLAWAALLHDIGKPATLEIERGRPRFHGHAEQGARMVEAISERFRFSNDERERIGALVRGHSRLADFPAMRQATRRRLLADPDFPFQLALYRADRLGSRGDLSLYETLRAALLSSPPGAPLPPPLLTGNDLISLGFPPGPEIGRRLSEIREKQLNEELRSREEALEFVKKS